MRRTADIKLGELEIPRDYFTLDKEDKDELCNQIMDTMLTIIDKSLRPEINRLKALDKMLESSIITNQAEEKYEICQVLVDIRNLLNE